MMEDKTILLEQKRIKELLKTKSEALIKSREGMVKVRSGYVIALSEFRRFVEIVCHYIDKPDYKRTTKSKVEG